MGRCKSTSATVVTWNVEWVTPRSWSRRDEILRRIERHEPDVVCLTETDVRLLSDLAGHTIHSQPDGVKATAANELRKVLLWSREPWERVDDCGCASMPPGKFVSGATRTPLGMMTVIGICIPFHGARTRWTNDGVKRKAWEDHQQYLIGLSDVLERTRSKRVIVIGDFNQQVGQPGYAPSAMRDSLRSAVPPHLTIATAALGFAGRRVIDHIALSEDLSARSLGLIDRFHQDRQLSDHHGIVADLSAQGWDTD